MTGPKRALAWILAGGALVGGLAYLHDPPWAGGITSGLRDRVRDQAGTSYRWTNGHASFYVPGDVVGMTLPLRAGIARPDGRPVTVSIFVDDRWLTTQRLAEAPDRWILVAVPLPARPGARRFRRVEIRVRGVIPGRNLGVQLGEPVLTHGGGAS